ncbi:MAG: ubiquitin-like domain-containing protein [Actinomycetota bacterium]
MQRTVGTSPALGAPVIERLDGTTDAAWNEIDPARQQRVLNLVRLNYTPEPKPGSVFGGLFRMALAVGLAAGCGLYFQAQKRVVVTDGGSARTIETFAPNVGEVLERSGVEMGARDRVAPAPGSALLSGDQVEVLRSKNVVVMINGQRGTEQVTGRTVEEVLGELSIASQGALVDPPPDTSVSPDDEIVVAQPVNASVLIDGQTRPITTNVLTAGGLLRQIGVVLGPNDRVEPSILAYPSEGSTIKVVRVNQIIETVHSKIPFKTVSEQNDKLELGIRKVKHAGLEGTKASTFRVLYEDGKVQSRTFMGSEVVREPVPETTLVGTFRPTLKSASSGQTGGASWYHQPGLMAAHRSLPFGTIVRVTNLANNKQVTVTIRDRGPYIDGRIIDLSDTAFDQLSPRSRGLVQVKIEW